MKLLHDKKVVKTDSLPGYSLVNGADHRIWIPSLSQASVNSYESYSVVSEMTDFPGLKIPGSDAALPYCFRIIGPRGHAHK